MKPLAVLVLAAGCGRFGFELGDRPDGGDAASDSAADPLVAYYPLDGDCANLAGPGLSGTCVAGQCPTTTPGMFGSALLFDGVDDSCEIAFDPRLQLTTGFTVSLWFEPVDFSINRSLVSKYLPTGPGASFEIAVSDANQLRFCTNAVNEECLDVVIGASMQWHHVVVTWDGAIKRVYYFGTEIGTAAGTITWSNLPMLISGDREDGLFSGSFYGAIDELRIYDRALTPAEVKALD